MILGKAFKEKRDKVIIATKFGTDIHEGARKVDEFPDHQTLLGRIRKDCEDSLRRLETDYIDLYQFHQGVYPLDQALEVRQVLEALVTEGKIRFYGWSTDDLDCARLFAEGEKCVAIQHTLNVLMDAPELLTLCEDYQQASINRGPLGRGILTGKYTLDSTFPENDNRHREKFHKSWTIPILEKLDDLREVLTSEGRTLTQGALAWIWARNPLTIPIPGFKSEDQIRENAAAVKFGPLKENEMRQINQILGR
jgi:aryl-alcohol dehydrogenase-like predicted oxidoreductase